MKSLAITVSLLAAVVLASGGLTAQYNPTKGALMKAKAGYAHKLLDAVVQDDFEAIQDQAFRLKAVTESAEWNASKSPEYVRESDAFIHATEKLYDASKAEDGDATMLAFVDLTLRCVRCHRGLKER